MRWFRLRHVQDFWKLPLSNSNNGVVKLQQKPISRILIATSVGAHLPATTLESLLGVALKQRNAEVHYLLCDGVLPACQDCTLNITLDEQEFAKDGPQEKLCGPCVKYPDQMLQQLHQHVHHYGDYLSADDKKQVETILAQTSVMDIEAFEWQGMAIGEHAMAGALRFYGRGELEHTPEACAILKRYFQAALLTAFMTKNLLAAIPFDVAVFHHGIYVPQGVIGDICRQAGVRVVNWNPAFRQKSFIFSHEDTYHRTMMEEPTHLWEDISWEHSHEKELMDYLKSRRDGARDWISFQRNPQENFKAIQRRYPIDINKPSIGILTNVLWDARLHYPANVFPNMLDWLRQTIRHFYKREDLNIIIRVHPAEVTGGNPSHQRVVDEIRKTFGELPKHFFVVGPEDPASTYVLTSHCNAVIVYGTKTGVELSTEGIPVIVAGEAWVRGKGITHDPKNQTEYFNLLDQLPFDPEMSSDKVTRAKKYAYHFFFRRMIPLQILSLQKSWPLFKLGIDSFEELMPGKDHGLDVICDGILEGKEFIYPQEAMN